MMHNMARREAARKKMPSHAVHIATRPRAQNRVRARQTCALRMRESCATRYRARDASLQQRLFSLAGRAPAQ